MGFIERTMCCRGPAKTRIVFALTIGALVTVERIALAETASRDGDGGAADAGEADASAPADPLKGASPDASPDASTNAPGAQSASAAGSTTPRAISPSASAPRVIDTRPLRLDYNAPDPNRTGLNYLRALANVGFANYAAFQFNWFAREDWANVSYDTLGKSLSAGFVWDGDKLPTNFFEHPYHGALYFTSARAAGLSFWESVPYAFIGSLSWELFGEAQPPSPNDLMSTSISGVILGEAFYRLSSEVLDDSASGGGRLLRELAAAAISPMRGWNRLYTGAAWQNGPPPERARLVRAEVKLGIDRFRTVDLKSHYAPTALAAIGIEYGDLLPTNKDETLDPFEFFDLAVSANLSSGTLTGAEVYAQGLLYGWSSNITSDSDASRDNDVFGFVQSYDFQVSSIGQFGGMSIGPGNYIVWRFSPHRRLRIGADVDWTFLSGLTSPYATKGRDYNFSMGAALGTSLLLEMGKYGELGWRSKHYVTSVVDGEKGEDVAGYARFWYNLDVIDHFGFGISPTVFDRHSTYSNGQTVGGGALETQVYLRAHD